MRKLKTVSESINEASDEAAEKRLVLAMDKLNLAGDIDTSDDTLEVSTDKFALIYDKNADTLMIMPHSGQDEMISDWPLSDDEWNDFRNKIVEVNGKA